MGLLGALGGELGGNWAYWEESWMGSRGDLGLLRNWEGNWGELGLLGVLGGELGLLGRATGE